MSTKVAGQTLVDKTRITLAFVDDSLSAVAGCNTMVGGFTMADNVLKVATLASTRMACEADLTAQDAWIAAFLEASPKVSLADNVLTLTGEGTTVTFGDRKDVAKESVLDGGAWTIVSLEATAR